MKRIGRYVVPLLATVMATALAAGCNSGQPSASPTGPTGGTSGATPTGSARPSASASASAEQLIEFTVSGAGPYQLGMTLTQLQAKPGLDEVAKGGAVCPENTFARGVGVWKDVRLSFHADGKLYLLVNRSESIPTPSGAWLGTTVADLKKIYAGLVTQDLTRGTNSAFLVQTMSGGGLLFELDPAKKVLSMTAADAFYLRNNYQTGTDFC